jgi:hypothetical protein
VALKISIFVAFIAHANEGQMATSTYLTINCILLTKYKIVLGFMILERDLEMKFERIFKATFFE